eukprot:g8973.t1
MLDTTPSLKHHRLKSKKVATQQASVERDWPVMVHTTHNLSPAPQPTYGVKEASASCTQRVLLRLEVLLVASFLLTCAGRIRFGECMTELVDGLYWRTMHPIVHLLHQWCSDHLKRSSEHALSSRDNNVSATASSFPCQRCLKFSVVLVEPSGRRHSSLLFADSQLWEHTQTVKHVDPDWHPGMGPIGSHDRHEG